MFDITTIGTATIDTFLDLEDITYHEVENKKERYYCLPVGGKLSVKNVQKHFGGNAANTAVGFSYFKLKTAIITSLGDCTECKSVVDNLKQKKVKTKYVKISKQCKTAEINSAFILDWHKNKHDRIILSYHKQKNFNKIAWPKTKWLYLTSLGKYYKTVIQQLPKNPELAWNPGSFEINQGIHTLLPIFAKTHILILNKTEAAELLHIQPNTTNVEFLLNNILKLGPKIAAITSGVNGAYAKNKETQEMHFETSFTWKVYEVTGAGDAFASGFVAAYIKDKSLQECLRYGILNATSCITKAGAQNGLLKSRQIKKMYNEQYGTKKTK